MTTTKLRPMTRIIALARRIDGMLYQRDGNYGGERELLRQIFEIATEADARGGKRERAKPYTSGAKRAKKARATK